MPKAIFIVISMVIELASKHNIDSWMSFVDSVKESFPGLETKEALEQHQNTVLEFMYKNSAICARIDDKIIGALLFSKEDNKLCFLAVDVNYRRQHIAEKMFYYMLSFLDLAIEITVTTYRADVLEGIPARSFYKKLGFIEGELKEEFGTLVQEFTLKAKK